MLIADVNEMEGRTYPARRLHQKSRRWCIPDPDKRILYGIRCLRAKRRTSAVAQPRTRRNLLHR